MKPALDGLTCETVSDVAGRRPEASLVPTFEGRELDAKDLPETQAEIRYIGDMQRLQVKPGDVFVLNVDEVIDESTAERLRGALREVLGKDAKVLVLCGGLTLGVIGLASKAAGGVRSMVDLGQDKSIDKSSVAATGVASLIDLWQSK